MVFLRKYLSLIRIYQWYKNLVIFLPLFFLGDFFNVTGIILTVLGFICLCLVSSSNYIFNDILDRHKDRLHPEKKTRPIASGEVGVFKGFILAMILLVISLWLAFGLSIYFFLTVASLFSLTTIYSLVLKNEPFIDILLIGVNFVLRAIGGTFILDATISPWLIICTFFLSLFLSVSKRRADLMYLGEKAAEHKPVLKFYNKSITNSLLSVITTTLIISYTLYSFSDKIPYAIITLPVAMYAIFRFLQLSYSGSKIARRPHLVIHDVRLVLAIIVWVLLLGVLIYL
ncbi:hypothetical protein CL622_08240 [archaeon]|nr:hypothetical protein [archaeon]